MTHPEMDDLYELFVLGALEPELAAEIEQHLLEQCSYCVENVQEATHLTAVMAGIAEQVEPPAQLRARVAATVKPNARQRTVNWMFAAAALAAACVALAVFSVAERSELQRSSGRVQAALSERDQARLAVANASSAERAQIAALTAERDQLRLALATANNTARTQLAALTGERDRLRSALAAATSKAAVQMAALTGERDQLRSALAAANDTARAQVAAVTGERDQLRSELANATDRARAQAAALTSERDQLRSELANVNNTARTEVAGLTGEVDQLRSALAVMRRPDTRSIRFGKPDAPHGWVFANRNGGLVLVGSELPSVASDRTLELWLVPKAGAPQAAGLFRPSDAAGDAIHISSLAVNPSEIKAVAVSEEPREGSTAPTTKPFLLVPVGS